MVPLLLPLLGALVPVAFAGAVWAADEVRSPRGQARRIRARFPQVSPELADAIVNVADAVGTNSFALAKLINYETAGTFSPSIVNEASGATGLIQFMPRTAERLGTTTAFLASLTAVQQMRWVRVYLNRVRRGQWPDDRVAVPLNTPQRLYMSVFYPPARNAAPAVRFPPNVIRNNPHVPTPAAYIRAVEERAAA